MKPHNKALLTGWLVDLAVAYHDHQSLRARISHALSSCPRCRGRGEVVAGTDLTSKYQEPQSNSQMEYCPNCAGAPNKDFACHK